VIDRCLTSPIWSTWQWIHLTNRSSARGNDNKLSNNRGLSKQISGRLEQSKGPDDIDLKVFGKVIEWSRLDRTWESSDTLLSAWHKLRVHTWDHIPAFAMTTSSRPNCFSMISATVLLFSVSPEINRTGKTWSGYSAASRNNEGAFSSRAPS
jgi:hypothetical protein